MKSLILKTNAHIIASLMLVFSIYLLLRGHNEPGGGFIGALVAVIAFALLIISESPNYLRKRLHYLPFTIAFIGMFLILCAGILGILHGSPYLSAIWWKTIGLGTPILFDIGIYLAVLGSITNVFLRIHEELD